MAPRSLSDYTVAWICPLYIERAAALSMLDEEHEAPLQPYGDDNIYSFGRIGNHNVVIAGLSSQGIAAATIVASQMLRTFGESLRVRMLVGIGGGVPGPNRDIRLGDVVIGEPSGDFGGVIQTDRGKHEHDGFHRTGHLNQPPRIMLQAVAKLRAELELRKPKFPDYIDNSLASQEQMGIFYKRPEGMDVLFKSDYKHHDATKDCSECDHSEDSCIQREPRSRPGLWFGNIASSNAVMKNGVMRDKTLRDLDVLCFEMEAAGLMNDFECLVIRGISDYADSHKNDDWQRHAALAAAACAKEVLLLVPPIPIRPNIAAHMQCILIQSPETVRNFRGIRDFELVPRELTESFILQYSNSPAAMQRVAQLTGTCQGQLTPTENSEIALSPQRSAVDELIETETATMPAVPQQDSPPAQVQLTGLLGPPCRKSCKCACHRRFRFSFGGRTTLVGSFSLSLASIGWFRKKCTLTTCKRSALGAAAFQYTFPLWLINRMLAAWANGVETGPNVRWSLGFADVRIIRTDAILLAEQGRVEDLHSLYLNGGAGLNDADPADGETALMAAIRTKQVPVVQYLLQNGAAKEQPDFAGFTPGDYLLCAIYGPNLTDKEKCSELSAKFGMTDVIDDQDFTSLHRIVLGISARDLEAEVAEHSDLVNEVDAQGRSPLYWATWRNNTDQVSILLRAGADGSLYDMEGQTPLHLTATTGSAELARIILDFEMTRKKSSLNQKNKSGYCPWHIAIVHDSVAVLQVLLQHECDLQLKTNFNRSIMHLAMRFGSLAAAQALQQAVIRDAPLGADHSGKTPADYLAERGERPVDTPDREPQAIEALQQLLASTRTAFE